MIIVLFGVSGAGKTTIGRLLADDLCWRFYDADDLHPAANVEKMRSGTPLDDKDRQGWLLRLRDLIKRTLQQDQNAVLACSALKRSYREYLQIDDRVKFVLLQTDFATIEDRLRGREGHFMNTNLLTSQFEILETSAGTEIVVDAALPLKELLPEIKWRLFTKA